MSGSRALLAVPVVLAAVLGPAGCRGVERAALPVPVVSSPAVAPSSLRTGSTTADPLAGVEATVDAIEHDVDTDAGADSATGR
jgi:hypothetical protein